MRQSKLIKAPSASERWQPWILVHLFSRILPFRPAGLDTDAEKTVNCGAKIPPHTGQILSLYKAMKRDGSLGICRVAGYGGVRQKQLQNTKPRGLRELTLPGRIYLNTLILLQFASVHIFV